MNIRFRYIDMNQLTFYEEGSMKLKFFDCVVIVQKLFVFLVDKNDILFFILKGWSYNFRRKGMKIIFY